MPKLQAIKLNKDFRRAYYQGKFKAHPLLVTYRVGGRGNSVEPRVGITTSKKIGSAVQRNRARRIIRQAFAELLREERDLFGSSDFVFVARAQTPDSTTAEVKKVMHKQLLFLANPANRPGTSCSGTKKVSRPGREER